MSTPDDARTSFDDARTAFPVNVNDENTGMTLRDWMAGQAIASVSFSTMQRSALNEIAEHSYALADAMLAARARKEGAQ